MGGRAIAVTAACRLVRAICQGQRSGRWTVRRRAEPATRPGMLIRWVRRVAVVARAVRHEALLFRMEVEDLMALPP